MSKGRDKKRLLLDEEELKPRADAWDIFYGRTPVAGVKTDDAPQPSRAERVQPPALPAQPSAEAPIPPETPPTPELTDEKPKPAALTSRSEEKAPAPPPENIRIEAIKPLTFRAHRTHKTENHAVTGLGAHAAKDIPPFEEWVRRWSPWLKRGATVSVCRAFYDLTYGEGREDCFTSNSVIMRLTGLSRSQCIRNIHHLIEAGFLEEIGQSNDKHAKGTHYRFNLVPTSLSTN